MISSSGKWINKIYNDRSFRPSHAKLEPHLYLNFNMLQN